MAFKYLPFQAAITAFPFHWIWRHSENGTQTHFVQLTLLGHALYRESECVILLDSSHAEIEPSSVVANCCVRHPVTGKPAVKVLGIVLSRIALRQISRVKFTRDDNAVWKLEGILCWLPWINWNVKHGFILVVWIHALFGASLHYFIWLCFPRFLSRFFYSLLVCLNFRFIFRIVAYVSSLRWLVNKWNDSIAVLPATVVEIIFVTHLILVATVILNLGLLSCHLFLTQHGCLLVLFTFHLWNKQL